MRVLLYSHYFAPSFGGVEAVVLSLARGLAESKEFEITLVTQTAAGNFADESLVFRVVRQPRAMQLWRLVCQCDLVHVSGPAFMPMLFAKLARKPLLVEHHGYQAICPNGLLIKQPDVSPCPGHFEEKKYWKCLSCRAAETSWFSAIGSLLLMVPRRFLVRRAQKNVAVSQHVLRRNALPRSAVIYHGIEDQHVLPISAGAPPSEIVFAYVGRFVSEKGIPILLQATEMLVCEGHRFSVRLIGDGPERGKIDTWIQRAGLKNVEMTGYLRGKALSNALSGVSAVVIPSICEETAGLAAIEQMMRGGLVIVSNVGGLGEVVGDAGLRFAAGDASGLADCMRLVLQNSSLAGSLGRKARDRAGERFQISRMVEEHTVEYRQLLGGRIFP